MSGRSTAWLYRQVVLDVAFHPDADDAATTDALVEFMNAHPHVHQVDGYSLGPIPD